MNTTKKASQHPTENPPKSKSGVYPAIRPPPFESDSQEKALLKVAVLDDTARKLLREAARYPAKPAVDIVYSLPAAPGGRGRVSTRVRFESGREVLLEGRMGKKEARKRAATIVEAEFTARLVAACHAASNWLQPMAVGGGASRPVLEAFRLLRAALESSPQTDHTP